MWGAGSFLFVQQGPKLTPKKGPQPPPLTTFIGRRPSVEDELQLKMTFVGRGPSLEDNLQRKTTFGGRRPLVEDDLQWKTTFVGRWPLVEDDLMWKTTFGRRRPLVKDNLQWKTTFGGRRPSMEDNLRLILSCCLIRFVAFLGTKASFNTSSISSCITKSWISLFHWYDSNWYFPLMSFFAHWYLYQPQTFNQKVTLVQNFSRLSLYVQF